jgi:hypothetical protein
MGAHLIGGITQARTPNYHRGRKREDAREISAYIEKLF